MADTGDGGTRLLRVRGQTRQWWLTASMLAGISRGVRAGR
jgi:hypothetical protein